MQRLVQRQARPLPAVAILSLLALGCPSSSGLRPQFSTPVSLVEPNRELDTGHINVHASVARAVPFGADRLLFGSLADVNKIYGQLQSTNQLSRTHATYDALSAGLSFTAPVLQSLKATSSSSEGETTKQTKKSVTETAEGKTKATAEDSDSTDRTAESGAESEESWQRVGSAELRPGELALPAGTAAAGVTPYELFYTTAETYLAARSLETLYNVAGGPDGWSLFSIPIVAAFEPGRVTRSNYTAETVIKFSLLKDGTTSAARLRLLAVAPAGLSSFASSSMTALERLQAALGAGVPLGVAAAELQLGAVRETLDAFTSMARRPDVQVAIADSDTLVVRYLGRETFDGGIALSPMSFNMEVLALIETDTWRKELSPSGGSPSSAKRFFIAAQGERTAASVDIGEIQLRSASHFKPSFYPAGNRRGSPESASRLARADAIPTYEENASADSPPAAATTKVTAYIPPESNRIDGAVYFPDGRIVISGAFRKDTCTCLELFVGSETARTELAQECRWADRPIPSLVYDVKGGKHPTKEQKESLIGRVSMAAVSGSSGCEAVIPHLASSAVLDRVAILPIKLSSPLPKTPDAPGTASIATVLGSLDDLGATLYLEYNGDSADPLVLVDGQVAPRTRLELVRKKTEKSAPVVGGRVWVRIPGNHEPKLMEKTFVLSVGAGTETKETRVIVAKR